MSTKKILGLSGSLRRGSINTAVLRAARQLCPDGMVIEIASIAEIPLYNGDLEADGGPEPVRALKAQIAAADGLLIATPEYNFSVPGALKNAIDWASRPPFKSVLVGKPAAIVGASPSSVGTARAQRDLRDVLYCTACELFPYREVTIGDAARRFEGGELTDERTREIIAEMLAAYDRWLGAR